MTFPSFAASWLSYNPYNHPYSPLALWPMPANLPHFSHFDATSGNQDIYSVVRPPLIRQGQIGFWDVSKATLGYTDYEHYSETIPLNTKSPFRYNDERGFSMGWGKGHAENQNKIVKTLVSNGLCAIFPVRRLYYLFQFCPHFLYGVFYDPTILFIVVEHTKTITPRENILDFIEAAVCIFHKSVF